MLNPSSASACLPAPGRRLHPGADERNQFAHRARNIVRAAAMTLTHRVYILNNGHIAESLSAQSVRGQPELLHRHLGV
jgi:hypothetical protein